MIILMGGLKKTLIKQFRPESYLRMDIKPESLFMLGTEEFGSIR